MASSDLMFTPAADLAARVRGGELSARELVQASLDRIEALDGELNAFVEVDAERALAAADEIQPGDTRPFAGVPIAIKANVPVEGLPMNFGSRFLGGHRPGHSAYLVRRLREAGFVVVGVTNLPEFGILPDHRAAPHRARPATRGTSRARPAAPPAARRRRSPPAWCRSRTATTAAARSASRPPAAGSSGSSPAAAASRAGPTSATRSWSPTACSRARSARPPRCSTCWPATRSATPRGRRAPPRRTRAPSAATRAGCGSR